MGKRIKGVLVLVFLTFVMWRSVELQGIAIICPECFPFFSCDCGCKEIQCAHYDYYECYCDYTDPPSCCLGTCYAKNTHNADWLCVEDPNTQMNWIANVPCGCNDDCTNCLGGDPAWRESGACDPGPFFNIENWLHCIWLQSV